MLNRIMWTRAKRLLCIVHMECTDLPLIPVAIVRNEIVVCYLLVIDNVVR